MRVSLPSALRLLLVCAAITAHAVVHAQTVSLTGLVRDTTGGVLPGVTVRLTRGGTVVATTTTTADGTFRFLSIPVSQLGPDMEVEVSLQGFASARRAVSLLVGQSNSLIIELSTGERPPPPPPPPPPRPETQREPVWNVWPQSVPTSDAGVKPEASITTSSDFVLVIDFSGVALSSTPGATSTAPSQAIRDLLAKASDQNQLSLQVVLVPDERSFRLRDQAARVRTLQIDLTKVRQFRGPASESPDEARRLLENREASFGRVEFPLRTTDRAGLAGIALSFWINGSVPVDELSVPLCIVPKGSTTRDCTPQPVRVVGLTGHDSARVAAGTTGMQLPDGALQFMELDPDSVVGVFRCNTCGWSADKFLSWRLKRSLPELKGHLLNSLTDFETSVSDATRRTHGQGLYFELFDGENGADVSAARRAFSDFVHAHRTSTPGDSPSLFVRLLAASADSTFTVPIGLLTLPDAGTAPVEQPIGLQFRVETPLYQQDYTPASTCISRWAGLVPDPSRFDQTDEMYELGQPLAPWERKFAPPGRPDEVFSDLNSFRSWVSDTSAAPAAGGMSVLIASHHDANNIFFDDANKMESSFVQRSLGKPSIVIMNACGTGKPGQSDFVRRFNEKGATAAIATATNVPPAMGAAFVTTLLTLATQHKTWPLGELFFQTLVKLSGTYKTETLSYILLGNAGLRICLP